LRRWWHRPFAASSWREFASFRHALRREEYAVVLDLQEQVKGALIARMARGERHGPDRVSIREPVASFLHDRHHAIDPAQHFIVRCRELAAAGARLSGRGSAAVRPRAATSARGDGAG
jgi:heptosyltransferase-1